MASRISPYVDNTGLVFAYDLANVNRSYLGEPTTNLAAGLGLTDLGAGLSFVGVEDGWLKYSMSATWSGGGYPYSIALNGVNFTGGQPYSVVAILRTNVENKFNYFCTNGISYVNQPKDYEGTLSATLNSDGSRTVRRVNFAYTSTTGQLGYLFTNPINGITFNPATDFVYLKALQAEQKPHPTPFTTGTRSVTQGLKDLTGNSTIDLTNVSFDGNAQMTFDGTDDYAEMSSFNVDQNNEFTLEAIIYPNTISGNQSVIKKNTSNDNWPIFSMNLVGSNINGYYSSINYGQCLEGADGTSGIITANKFWHIAYSKGSGGFETMKLYINGMSVPYTNFLYGSHINNIASSNKPIHIGRNLDGAAFIQPFNGLIPISRVFNRQLTDSEILQNFNAIKGRYSL